MTELPKIVAGVMAASICLLAPAGAQEASWDQIVEAARGEGKVVWYTDSTAPSIPKILEAFNRDYPFIEVEPVRLSSSPLVVRIQTELASGIHGADAVYTTSDQVVDEGVAGGWAETWQPPEIANFDPKYNDSDRSFVVAAIRILLAWNTTVVSEDERPRDWMDLVDARFRDKVGIVGPWTSPTIALWSAFVEKTLDKPDFAQQLLDNGVVINSSAANLSQALVRGDVSVAPMVDSAVKFLVEDGVPLEFAYPPSGTVASYKVAFVAAQAPHPNAAKVFVNWMLSENGQNAWKDVDGLAMARTGIADPGYDLPGGHSEGLSNVILGKTLISAEEAQELVGRWQEIFGLKQ